MDTHRHYVDPFSYLESDRSDDHHRTASNVPPDSELDIEEDYHELRLLHHRNLALLYPLWIYWQLSTITCHV